MRGCKIFSLAKALRIGSFPSAGRVLPRRPVSLSLVMSHALCARDGSVGVMGNLMAGQRATVATAVIRNRSTVVLSHHVDVEIHQALARHPGSHRTHAVRGMTRRTGESILRYVITVMGETRVTHDVGQIMAP